VALGIALVALLPALIPWSKRVPLGNGYARFTKPPFVRAIFPEAHGTISYYCANGQAGTVDLWQNIFDGPVMLIPAAETNVLICVYDFDTCIKLLKIHTDRPFKPLPSDSYLNSILFSCTSEIEDGASHWDEVTDYLLKVSQKDFYQQTVSVGLRGYASGSNLLAVARPAIMGGR
jgi:hypothetical protein